MGTCDLVACGLGVPQGWLGSAELQSPLFRSVWRPGSHCLDQAGCEVRRSSCLSLQSAGLPGAHHHAWQPGCFSSSWQTAGAAWSSVEPGPRQRHCPCLPRPLCVPQVEDQNHCEYQATSLCTVTNYTVRVTQPPFSAWMLFPQPGEDQGEHSKMQGAGDRAKVGCSRAGASWWMVWGGNMPTSWWPGSRERTKKPGTKTQLKERS